MNDSTAKSSPDARFWNRTQRLLQVASGVSIMLAVWLVGFRNAAESAPVLPDTDTQFSLDLEVTATVDHELVYAVEQRARPSYRIFSLDPSDGAVETVFTVPEDAIIFGIALSPSRSTLAVAYSPDFTLEGSGIWLLDLDTFEMTEHLPVTADRYLTDIAWAPDEQSILATHVDRSTADEALSAVRISTATGETTTLGDNAINPVQLGETVYYLTVDDTKARRTIGVLEPSGELTQLDVGDSGFDLDHLTAGADSETLWVATLEVADSGLTIGAAAEAHGNHDLPSTWWAIDVGAPASSGATALEPTIVYDAAATTDSIVYATNEGLSIGTTERVDVIASRSVRFVAA